MKKVAVIGGGLLGLRATKAIKEFALEAYLPPYAAPTLLQVRI